MKISYLTLALALPFGACTSTQHGSGNPVHQNAAAMATVPCSRKHQPPDPGPGVRKVGSVVSVGTTNNSSAEYNNAYVIVHMQSGFADPDATRFRARSSDPSGNTCYSLNSRQQINPNIGTWYVDFFATGHTPPRMRTITGVSKGKTWHIYIKYQ